MVDYGIVHHDLCRELFTLRIRTEKKLLFMYLDFPQDCLFDKYLSDCIKYNEVKIDMGCVYDRRCKIEYE